MFESEVVDPPVLPGALTLLDVIGSNPLFVPECLMILHISKTTHESVMEDDNLFILGEEDVKLDEVGFVKGGFNTLECILREETGVAAMRDDLGFRLESEFEIHLIINGFLFVKISDHYR